MSAQLSRRWILGSAGAISATLLAGCSPANRSADESSPSVAPPSYQPFRKISPDLPGTDSVDPGFLAFPEETPESVAQPPGSGETITAMAHIHYALPPNSDSNSWWAGLNDRLGVDLEVQMVPAADYSAKFATTIAGNDLPDMIMTQTVPNLPSLLKARFADLSDHLSGAAIADFPNLANLPAGVWANSTFGGRIYGVPIPRGLIGSWVIVRKDLLDAAGASLNPESFDEFTEGARALTNPGRRRWAFGTAGHARAVASRFCEAPPGWRLEGERLVNAVETEEFARAVDTTARWWKAGVIHPDAFSGAAPWKEWFSSGTASIMTDGPLGWPLYLQDNKDNPGFELGLLTVPTFDGGGVAPWPHGPGFLSMTALKQADPERIRLQLRVLDWLAAPFGSAEYKYRRFGQEGVDHTTSDAGDPLLTKDGVTNLRVPVEYLADAPAVLYQPGRPQDVKVQHAYESKVLANPLINPAQGLWSETQSVKGSALTKSLDDVVHAIIQGRRPAADLAEGIAAWRTGGGDQIRTELTDQL